MNAIKSHGNSTANSQGGNSTQISGNNATINIGQNLDDVEKYYKGGHIKAIDIIKSQRVIIEKLQYQIDRMQTQVDSMQEIKNKLVIMLMKLLDEHNNK